MEKLSLVDNSIITGTDFKSLEAALTDIDKRRVYERIQPEDLRFFVLDKYTPTLGTGVLIPPERNHYQALYQRVFADEIKDIPPELRAESIDVGVFFVCKDPEDREKFKYIPVSKDALDDLLVRVGLHGKATDYKSPLLMEYVCEAAVNQYDKIYQDPVTGKFEAIKNGNSQKDSASMKRKVPSAYAVNKKFGLTMVMLKEDESEKSVRKIFSFRSDRYTPIEQENVLRCIEGLKPKDKKEDEDLTGKTPESHGLGEPTLHHWSVGHFMTEAYVTFNTVTEEFSRSFKLPYKVAPALRIKTSDCGRSSLNCSRCYVLEHSGVEIALDLPVSDNESRYELTRHFGKADIDALVKRITKNLHETYKSVPEKLNQLAFHTGEAPTKETVRIAFKAMKLQRHAGAIISQDLEEKIVDSLSAMLPPVQRVFETVYAVLFSPMNEDLPITESQREALGQHVILSVFPVEEYQSIEIKAAVPAAV